MATDDPPFKALKLHSTTTCRLYASLSQAAHQGLQEMISCFDISDQPRLFRLLDVASDEVPIEAIHQIASGKYTTSHQLSADHVTGLLAKA